MKRITRSHFIFLILLVAGLICLYAPSLDHELVFDDERLTDGSIFGTYRQWFPLKIRALSYGTFIWIQDALGTNWPVQRAFNVLLHIATSIALYSLTLQLLERCRHYAAPGHDDPSPNAAVQVAIACWAFNPVAVYAVAYLIQRSILMATLGVVLSLLAMVQSLKTSRAGWYSIALLSWVLAVLSKEHAVALPLVVVPLIIFWQRPPPRTIAIILALSVGTLSVAAGLLAIRFSHVLGGVFDELSIVYAHQLDNLRPGARDQLYPLSIVNQAWLFFQYAYLWLIPNVGLMQLDIRPLFPLNMVSWPQTLGFVGYLTVLIGSGWLVLRKTGTLALVGLALLTPVLLFTTEFSTVWVQDPFVLYRSYLWSIGFPILMAVALLHIGNSKFILGGGVVAVIVLAALSFERITSFQDARTVWTDAFQKTDLNAPENALGRWRPALNLAREELLRNNAAVALQYAQHAVRLGEPDGLAHFNAGGALRALNRAEEAVQAFNAAEKQGYKVFTLYFQRGEMLMTLDRFPQAYADLELALSQAPNPALRLETLKLVAEAASLVKNYEYAVVFFEELHQQAPNVLPYVLSLAHAHFELGNTTAALSVLDHALAQAPAAPLHYARARVLAQQGQKHNALLAVNSALLLEPNNTTYLQFKRQLNNNHP